MHQEKLDSIMESAKKMFGRYGPRKTSLEEVARVARVAKATIYKHFGDKDRVYLEVLRREKDEVIKNILSEVGKESTPEVKLKTFVKAKFKYMRRAVNILNLDREGLEKVLPIAEDIRSDLFEREVGIIHAILIEGVEKGSFASNYPLFTARAFAHALRGFEVNWLIQESEEEPDNYLDELLRIVFQGLAPVRESRQNS